MLLGVAEAGVKRLADSGAISCLGARPGAFGASGRQSWPPSCANGLVAPAAALAAEGFVEKLLEQVWPLGPRERMGTWPAMVLSASRARTAATFDELSLGRAPAAPDRTALSGQRGYSLYAERSPRAGARARGCSRSRFTSAEQEPSLGA